MNVETHKNNFISKIFLFFLVALLVPVEGIYYINSKLYNVLFTYLTILCAFFVLCMYILSVKQSKRRMSETTYWLFLLAIYNILNTIFKHGDIRGAIGVWLYTIPILLLFELYKNKIEILLKVVLLYLDVLLFIDLLLIFFFPNGLIVIDNVKYGKMWLLGYKSSLQYYVIPAIAISIIFSFRYKNFFNSFFVLLVSHIICIYVSNTMLLVGLFLIDLIILLKIYKRENFIKKVYKLFPIFLITFYILIVLFTSILLANSFIQYVVIDLFGKNQDLSMRTNNWQLVIPAIMKNPVFGYGYTSNIDRYNLYHRETAHAHNIFLELLYENGIIGLVLFIIFNIKIFKNLSLNFDKDASRFLFYLLMIIYIMYAFENIFQKSACLIWLVFLSSTVIDRNVKNTS